MTKHIGIITCLFLSACMVGPDYREPKTQVAAHWAQKDSKIRETPFRDAAWWEVFHDPVLTTLVHRGYEQNLTLQAVGVGVLLSRAQLAQAVGQLYPQQQAIIGNYTVNRIGGGSLQDLLPQNFDTALLGFTASWEIDFWGKYRRAIESNNAQFLAQAAAYDNAIITLTSDVASTYVKIRTLEAQIRVTKANIAVQAEGVRIARSRFRAGQTSQVDVEQAKTELAETEGRLPGIVNSLQQQKNRLSLLLGTVPGGADEFLKKGYGIPKAPVSVAVGIPCETLSNRPDIYQARQEAIAQSAAIGATKANLFPSFSLNGTFALASNTINNNHIRDIFNWDNRTLTAGPGVNWPILNYGQITNAVRMQDAAFQQSLLAYMNLVLQAQQEVQDSISAFVQAKYAEEYLSRANAAATTTLKLALIRYREGETDFTPVLNAEQQLLRIQTSLTDARGDIPQALVALYRSLGGGWQIRNGHDVIPKAIRDEMAARTNWGSLMKPVEHVPPLTGKQQLKQLYLPKW